MKSLETPIAARPAVAATALLAALAAPAHAVPASLAAPSHETLTRSVAARGVQIYECRSGQGGPGWTFVAPEADLYDADGRRIGWHGAGPQWRFDDGSHVTASVKARADAPRQRAIPWLLLESRAAWAHRRHPDFGSIQRINTDGGVMPAVGCSADTLGHVLRVPYTADYHFYGSR